jgi:hypothetical protein
MLSGHAVVGAAAAAATAAAFAGTHHHQHSSIPRRRRRTTTTPCRRSASRLVLVLWEQHAGVVGASSQTYPPHPPPQHNDDATAGVEVEVETTPVSTTAAAADNTDTDNTAAVPRNRASWMDRVQQLQEYCASHGHTLVPKRYKANPALGNWVNKQRQSYRKYMREEQPCSLTSQQVDILNSIGFCWDASNVTTTTSTTTAAGTASTVLLSNGGCTGGDDDDAWWSRLKELERYIVSVDIDNNGNKNNSSNNKNSNNNVSCLANISRNPHNEAALQSQSPPPPPTPLRAWIREQQRNYQMNLLSTRQSEALSAIDADWWKSQRQVQWDVRYRQLQVYKAEHGDCCVPISYANKQLANWVHNQRKQYNLRQTPGKASDLTTERWQRLQDVGFVWNRWEYEFEKKAVVQVLHPTGARSAVHWNTR